MHITALKWWYFWLRPGWCVCIWALAADQSSMLGLMWSSSRMEYLRDCGDWSEQALVWRVGSRVIWARPTRPDTLSVDTCLYARCQISSKMVELSAKFSFLENAALCLPKAVCKSLDMSCVSYTPTVTETGRLTEIAQHRALDVSFQRRIWRNQRCLRSEGKRAHERKLRNTRCLRLGESVRVRCDAL